MTLEVRIVSSPLVPHGAVWYSVALSHVVAIVHVPSDPGHDVRWARYWLAEHSGEAAVLSAILEIMREIRGGGDE